VSLFKTESDGKTYFENGVYVGDILTDVDGYKKWWPNPTDGYLDELFLFAMGDYLKNLNADWDREVNKYFEETP